MPIAARRRAIRSPTSRCCRGSNYADTLTSLDRGGGSGAQLYGEGGHDTLIGRGGGDYLFGGAGNDWLDSGFGGDVLNGGIGADTFRFSTALGAGNVDTVQDFSGAEGDRIVLSRSVFAAAGYDALAGSAFALGAAATTAAHRIVYNQSAGELSYDADGAGAWRRSSSPWSPTMRRSPRPASRSCRGPKAGSLLSLDRHSHQTTGRGIRRALPSWMSASFPDPIVGSSPRIAQPESRSDRALLHSCRWWLKATSRFSPAKARSAFSAPSGRLQFV